MDSSAKPLIVSSLTHSLMLGMTLKTKRKKESGGGGDDDDDDDDSLK